MARFTSHQSKLHKFMRYYLNFVWMNISTALRINLMLVTSLKLDSYNN